MRSSLARAFCTVRRPSVNPSGLTANQNQVSRPSSLAKPLDSLVGRPDRASRSPRSCSQAVSALCASGVALLEAVSCGDGYRTSSEYRIRCVNLFYALRHIANDHEYSSLGCPSVSLPGASVKHGRSRAANWKSSSSTPHGRGIGDTTS